MDPVIIIAILLLYFIPALVATGRKHHNAGAITLLNLLLGWTVLGWIGALVWAATATAARPKRVGTIEEEQQYIGDRRRR